MSQIINHNGQRYEITNWDEFRDALLSNIGLETVREIQKEIKKMRLVDKGQFRAGVVSEVQNGELVLTNTAVTEDGVAYGVYLEYGTYEYWYSYGRNNFPETPHPKKRDMSKSEKQGYPMGMQPFAPYRRVLYNEAKMQSIIRRMVKLTPK